MNGLNMHNESGTLEKFLMSERRRRKARRVVAILAIVVLLTTTNSLKLNADTLEHIAACGLEEHSHTSSCSDEETDELVCERAEHTHTDACYQERPKEEAVSEDIEEDAPEEERFEEEQPESFETREIYSYEEYDDAPAETPAPENPYKVGRQTSVRMSEVLDALDLPVLPEKIELVQAVEKKEREEEIIAVEYAEDDVLVHILKKFETLRVAVVTDADVYIVTLLDARRVAEPTLEPTVVPTIEPTVEPTVVPTEVPTEESIEEPTVEPTEEPTVVPTVESTEEPTEEPTLEPTVVPTIEPTAEPTVVPTEVPTEEPTVEPTAESIADPTAEPTMEPTEEPTAEPTVEPTEESTEEPTLEPTVEPTEVPTEEPTVEPTEEPTAEPTIEPTAEPTVVPTEELTAEPTEEPTMEPTEEPTEEPTVEPTAEPTAEPTEESTENGAEQPSADIPGENVPAAYAATIDLTEVEVLPFSLRALMAQARENAEASEGIESDSAETNAEFRQEGETEAEESHTRTDMDEDVLPVDEWSVAFDEALLRIERGNDDVLVSVTDAFDTTIVTVWDGRDSYALTLLHGVEPEQRSVEAIELDMATIIAAEGAALPANAQGSASVLEGEDAQNALAEVQAYLARLGAGGPRKAPRGNAAEPQYAVFDITLSNVDQEEYAGGFEVALTLPERITGRNFRLYHVHTDEAGDASVTDITECMTLEGRTIDEVNGVQTVRALRFITDNFSAFVLSYTVDFEYEEAFVSIGGGSEISLVDLLYGLDIDLDAADIVDVRFSDDTLVAVRHSEEGWMLASLQPFESEEQLTIVLSDGKYIVIRVTDAQGGIGYVQQFKITSTKTGSGEFDNNDERGNDSGPDNNRIRSFDSIYYNVDAQAQTFSASAQEKGNLIYTFTIPNDPELELDFKAMGWAENQGIRVEGDQKIYTVKTNAQVQMPGHHMPQFVLKVGNKTEGYVIQPSISVCVEDNDTPLSKQCPETVVTSKPAYNVQLDLVRPLSAVNTYTINNQTIQGMLASYGFAVQMRNEEANQGLKGIELPTPQTPITFDIDLSSNYRKDGDDAQHDLSDYFPVQLYHVENNGDTTNSDHQLPASQDNGIVPQTGVVYQNGDVTITQDGAKLHVVINRFNVDLNRFPTTDIDGIERFVNNDGSILVGNISTYRFDLVQPTQWVVNGEERNIQSSYGENSENGTIQINAVVNNLTMESVTGAKVGDGEQFHESISTDNQQITDRQLYGGNATYDHQIFFSTVGKINDGTGAETKDHGTDTALIGANIAISTYFDQTGAGANNVNARTLAFDQLVKFDDAVLEPLENDPKDLFSEKNYNADWGTTDILYVGKSEGWNHNGLKPWQDGYDVQMRSIKQESDLLSYYKTLQELKNAGKQCVGVLIQWRGCSVDTDSDQMHVGHQIKLHVKNDANLLQNRDENNNLIASYMITMSTNAWTIQDALNAGANIQDNGDTGNQFTKYALFAMNKRKEGSTIDGRQNQHYFTLEKSHSVDVDRDDNYVKCKYGESGYIGEGTSGFLHGDTLYIVPYTTTITNHVAQKNGNEDKQSFDLDNHQRFVDFVLEGAMQFTEKIDVGVDDWKTKVTIAVDLPAGLTYQQGTAYVGGTYSERENATGIVMKGTSITPVQEGNKLIFTLENVPVKEGKIPEIHYSCFIGNIDYPSQDVINNQSLSTVATIQTSEDKRENTLLNGNVDTSAISVVKTAQFNIEKIGTDSIELDGQGVFHLLVNNYTSIPRENLYAIDLLPYNLKGKYKITNFTLNVDLLKNEEGNNTEDIEFYYATEESQLTKDGKRITRAQDISIEEVKQWSKASFDQTTGEITGFIDWPLAIAYVDAKFPALSVARMDMTYEGICGRIEDSLDNEFVEASLFTKATADVYGRYLSGTTWFDENKDGMISKGEAKLGGVTVQLYKLDENNAITNELVMETTTNEKGDYSFGVPEKIPDNWTEETIKSNILRAGNYAIIFSGRPVEQYKDVTQKQIGLESSNSKADSKEKEGDMLKSAVIQYVHMDSIPEMKTQGIHQQNVNYQNAGFITDTEMTIIKRWENVDKSTLDWAEGKTITLNLERDIQSKQGSATPTHDDSFESVAIEVDVNGSEQTISIQNNGNYNVSATVNKINDGTNKGSYEIVISGLPKYSPDMANDYLWYAKEGPLQDFGIRYPDTAVRVGDQQILVNYVIGYVLPSTGGVGTVPYRVAGALLAILSLLALMERRRHNH